MAKFVFKEYKIFMHDKHYHILIPDVKINEMWVLPEPDYWCADGTFVQGNQQALRWLRNAYTALALHPDVIVYFPLRNVKQIYNVPWPVPPDLVLYNYQIQFKRSEWKKLKETMRYIKPRQFVVRCNIPRILEEKERVYKEWRKRDSFYYKKNAIQDYYQYDTLFLEGNKKLSLKMAVDFQKILSSEWITEAKSVQYLTTVGWNYNLTFFELMKAEWV